MKRTEILTNFLSMFFVLGGAGFNPAVAADSAGEPGRSTGKKKLTQKRLFRRTAFAFVLVC